MTAHVEPLPYPDFDPRSFAALEPEKGTKYDFGKPPLDLLSHIALEETALVLAHGREKYGAHNWRKGIGHSRLIAAALRHIYAWNEGEDNDPESGISHLAHAMCCVMFALEESQLRPEFDDRYKHEDRSERPHNYQGLKGDTIPCKTP